MPNTSTLNAFVEVTITANDEWASRSPETVQYVGAIATPSRYTPYAISNHLTSLFTAGEPQSRIQSTLAALEEYYNSECQLGGGPWVYNDSSNTFQGNPTNDAEVRLLYGNINCLLVVSRPDVNGARPIDRPFGGEDLRRMYLYLGSPACLEDIGPALSVFLKAYFALAFTLWAKDDELLEMKMKHVTPRCDEQRADSFVGSTSFELISRRSTDTEHGPVYCIPHDPANPHSDCPTLVNKWVQHLESISPRPLNSEDSLFPLLELGHPGLSFKAMNVDDLRCLVNRATQGCRGTSTRSTDSRWRRGVLHSRSISPPKEMWPLGTALQWGAWAVTHSDNIEELL